MNPITTPTNHMRPYIISYTTVRGEVKSVRRVAKNPNDAVRKAAAAQDYDQLIQVTPEASTL